jgi:hypothetical protein
MSKKIELNDEQRGELKTLGAVLNQQQLADYFGFTKETLIQIFKRDPEALLMYKKGKSKAIADIAGSLISKARDGDTASAIFYLKTQAGWREVSRDEVESGNSEITGIRLVS